MRSRFFGFLVVATVALLCASECLGQRFEITPDKPDGVYLAGETVHWKVAWNGTVSSAPSALFKVLQGGLADAGSGSLTFSNNVAGFVTTFERPGTVLVEVAWKADDGKPERATGGAVAFPERIPLSAPAPVDFDAFWDAKLKELADVPPNPHLERVESGKPGVAYWKITMANIRGSRIQGQLARPSEGDKLPALLIVQWAGVYPLQRNWATDRAAQGWLVLNIEAHDLPIDGTPEFYREQSAGPLRGYPTIGNEDRDKSYFLRMYLSCYRAAEYLAERPDWDGKTLVVMGDSQGGMQSLVTAGLHPKITAALPLVPAGCDMLGPDIGRKGGWPQWYDGVRGKDALSVRAASRYYDVANFARRIRCPVLVGLGLLDETCPPAGVFAAVNQIQSAKEVVVLPTSGHQDRGGSQSAFRKRRDEAWLPALREGGPAPVR
jgi:cephalosporin-C deacetylase-like acetyl esterase